MGRDPFTKSDADFDTWMSTVASRLSVGYADFGITEAEAQAFGVVQEAFHDAYLLAKTALTRTPLNIILKDEKRQSLTAAARKLIRKMNVNGLTPYQREELGLPPRKERGRSPEIDFAPKIDMLSMLGHAMEMQFHNGMHRGRPEGVAGVTCFYMTGESPSENPSDWTFGFATTKTVGTLDFPLNLLPGTKVWVTAFWRNALDESGPAAEAVSSFIGFTQSSATPAASLRKAA